MSKPITENKYLADKTKRTAMIRRNVIESSVFEGIYGVTEAVLQKPLPARVPAPLRKTG